MAIKDYDLTNKFGVGSQDGKIVILFPPQRAIFPNEAMILAAWLAVLAEGEAKHTVQEFIAAIEGL